MGNFFLDILPGDKEKDVRSNLKAIIEKDLPFVTVNNFEFVKCNRATISYPNAPDGFEWDFQHIKALVGQGKLYIRLIVPAVSLKFVDMDNEENGGEAESSPSLPILPFENIADDVSNSYQVQNDVPSCSYQNDRPSCSYQPEPSDSYSNHELNQIVNDILDGSHFTSTSNNLDESLNLLKKNMKTDGSVKRLIIEPDYLFTDAMSYYKAADFDATLPLKIRYEGQVAIDGGGVLRQFFQDIFDAAETGSDGVPPLFEGDYGYKLPSSNALIVSSD